MITNKMMNINMGITRDGPINHLIVALETHIPLQLEVK